MLSSNGSADSAEEEEMRRLLKEEKEEMEAAVGRGWLPFFWLMLPPASCQGTRV